MSMLNLSNELEVTRQLHSEFRTDPLEWDRAMLRLRTIHRNNENPRAAADTVKVYRARLGLAFSDSEVTHDTLRNYGYGLLLARHGFH